MAEFSNWNPKEAPEKGSASISSPSRTLICLGPTGPIPRRGEFPDISEDGSYCPLGMVSKFVLTDYIPTLEDKLDTSLEYVDLFLKQSVWSELNMSRYRPERGKRVLLYRMFPSAEPVDAHLLIVHSGTTRVVANYSEEYAVRYLRWRCSIHQVTTVDIPLMHHFADSGVSAGKPN